MARGGARENAGRKSGEPNKVTQAKREAIAASGLTPLDYMLQVLRDEMQSQEDRIDAAKAAAPYVHAKLASVEHKGEGGGPMIVEIVRFADKPA